jgi:hypothetical protein
MKIKNLLFFSLALAAVLIAGCSDYSGRSQAPQPIASNSSQQASASSVLNAYDPVVMRTWSDVNEACIIPAGNCMPDAPVNPDNEGDIVSLNGTNGTQAAANLAALFPVFSGTTEFTAVVNQSLTINVNQVSGKYICFLATANNISQAIVVFPAVID